MVTWKKKLDKIKTKEDRDLAKIEALREIARQLENINFNRATL